MLKHKKVITILLSLMMVLCLTPTIAFAADDGGAASQAEVDLVGGNGTGGGNSESGVQLKINGGGSSFTVSQGETLVLESAVTGVDSYHIHWKKTDGIKYANFVVNGVTTADKFVSANKISLIGATDYAGTLKLTVEVAEGTSHSENCSNILKSKDITIDVVDNNTAEDFSYDFQGSSEQSIKIVSPQKITQLEPNADNPNSGEYKNKIEEPFIQPTPVRFTVIIEKGMGKGYKPEDFVEYALSEIEVIDANNNVVAAHRDSFNNLNLVSYNAADRSVVIEATGLEPGKYTLLFKKNMKPALDKAALGVKVSFEFTVSPPMIGVDGVKTMIQVDNKDFAITQDLKDRGIDTNEEVLNAMYEAALKLIGFDVNEDNSVVYDVKLLISTDGGKEWKPATKENFPKEGIKLELNYPEGTSAETQNFEVLHMVTVDGNGMKAGDVEKLNVKEGKEKLQVTVNSLSPFLIAWEDADAEAGINDGSAETGDNMNIALYAGIMILALCGGAAVFARRRKEQ